MFTIELAFEGPADVVAPPKELATSEDSEACLDLALILALLIVVTNSEMETGRRGSSSSTAPPEAEAEAPGSSARRLRSLARRN